MFTRSNAQFKQKWWFVEQKYQPKLQSRHTISLKSPMFYASNEPKENQCSYPYSTPVISLKAEHTLAAS